MSKVTGRALSGTGSELDSVDEFEDPVFVLKVQYISVQLVNSPYKSPE